MEYAILPLVIANVFTVQSSLKTFCMVASAIINWNKSFAFFIHNDPSSCHPRWCSNPQFQWISKGVPTRYLICQVEIDLSPNVKIGPLLLIIHTKIMFWSSAKLSLAGLVVLANNVLLSTMWHIASCWVFSKSLIMHVRHLIRNYLWSGKQGGDAYAKVAWEIIKRPKSKGGLDIVDLVDHCQALLVKLIVRGLLPSNQVWKSLLINKLADCSPKIRGPWLTIIRWIFLSSVHFLTPRTLEDRVFN